MNKLQYSCNFTPLLKKMGLNVNTAANYRPVSNLSVLKTAGKGGQSADRGTPK